jgi:hypothetical protein
LRHRADDDDDKKNDTELGQKLLNLITPSSPRRSPRAPRAPPAAVANDPVRLTATERTASLVVERRARRSNRAELCRVDRHSVAL